MDKNILFLEPFYGGSHKQLIDTILEVSPKNYDLITLSAKKWPWRARCSALKFSQMIPNDHNYKILFCSSVLNLTELLALRLDLQHLRKIVYFHENQLVYPKQQIKERDFQFGYNQITTCLVADRIIFNSNYNKNSFLNNINKFLKLMPDNRPVKIKEQIEKKCKVLHYPINFSQISITTKHNNNKLHIIWPHRWEFDKCPEDFFKILFKLKTLNIEFLVSVIGEAFTDIPEIFHTAKKILSDHIIEWGFVESKQKYYEILNSGNVVMSTAKHEFYGVAVLEAVYCGCFPLLPNDLVYPEIYDDTCLYDSLDDAVLKLIEMSKNIDQFQKKHQNIVNFEKYSCITLLPQYLQLFENK